MQWHCDKEILNSPNTVTFVCVATNPMILLALQKYIPRSLNFTLSMVTCLSFCCERPGGSTPPTFDHVISGIGVPRAEHGNIKRSPLRTFT